MCCESVILFLFFVTLIFRNCAVQGFKLTGYLACEELTFPGVRVAQAMEVDISNPLGRERRRCDNTIHKRPVTINSYERCPGNDLVRCTL